MKKLLQKFRLYPDTLDGKAVLISTLSINFGLVFLTLNFMWGTTTSNSSKKNCCSLRGCLKADSRSLSLTGC